MTQPGAGNDEFSDDGKGQRWTPGTGDDRAGAVAANPAAVPLLLRCISRPRKRRVRRVAYEYGTRPDRRRIRSWWRHILHRLLSCRDTVKPDPRADRR